MSHRVRVCVRIIVVEKKVCCICNSSVIDAVCLRPGANIFEKKFKVNQH